MLVIGNNKYRNLQEQVGFNTEQIEKILKEIDGMTLEDKLITISSSGGTLSAEELLIASGEIAFIYNTSSNKFYVKSAVDSSYHFVSCQISITSIAGGGYRIAQETVAVNATTGVYNTITSASQNVYSKSEMDTALALKADLSYVDAQLALKANLSGADFTGAVTARTLEQSEANYSKNFTVYGLPAGLSISAESFKAFKVINGVLFIIASLVVSNDTESDITGGFTLFANNVDSKVGTKIFKCDGTDLTEASTSVNFGWEICYSPITIQRYGGIATQTYSRIYSPSASRIDATVPSQSWLAGSKYLISIRVPIILV